MKRIHHSDLDRISGLPGNIIDNILACLPLPDAVRTSVLSRKWRFKCVTLPHLVFDNLSCSCPESPKNGLSCKLKLVSTVYQVLLHHKGPIVKFSLLNCCLESWGEINHWITYLSKNDIQDFTLHIVRGEPHKLPKDFYSFRHLRHLTMYNCVFKPPPTFKGSSSLLSLKFQKVVLETGTFGNFISSCPLLERLVLAKCSRFERLEINAPKLRSLSFYGVFKTLCFKNFPILARAAFGAENVDLVEGETSNLVKVLCCTTALESLCIQKDFFKFLAVGKVLKRLPFTLQHLNNLILDDLCFAKTNKISCVLCIIRSSPNLQILTIQVSTKMNVSMKHTVEYLRAQDFSGCYPNKLRKVRMFEISGARPELEFMKLILANSPVLEKLCVDPSRFVNDGGVKMIKELNRFPCASPKLFSMIDADTGLALDFLKAQEYSDVSLNQLREVRMIEVSGARPEFEFIKLMLAESPKLERMLIQPISGADVNRGFDILKETARFQRASTKAELIYLDPEIEDPILSTGWEGN